MEVLGHRGAAGEAPENTLAGFAAARALGVAGIEADVHLSADEVLVVIHDDTLDRTTNGQGAVSALTAAELRALDARAAFPDWPEPVGVPSLAEVLATFPDFGAYHIEIKRGDPAQYEGLCRQLASVVHRYGMAERVTAISFDPLALAAMRQVAPGLARGFTANYSDEADLQTALALDCASACPNVHRASAEVVAAVRARGLHVVCWTCNTAADLDAALALKADSVDSDLPTFALSYLRDREDD